MPTKTRLSSGLTSAAAGAPMPSFQREKGRYRVGVMYMANANECNQTRAVVIKEDAQQVTTGMIGEFVHHVARGIGRAYRWHSVKVRILADANHALAHGSPQARLQCEDLGLRYEREFRPAGHSPRLANTSSNDTVFPVAA